MKKTKGFMVWSLVLLLAGISLTACSNADDENAPITCIEPPIYQVNDALWQKLIVGHGWKHVVSYAVENGKITNRNFYEDMIGISPHDLYFAADSVTTYFYSNALGGSPRKVTKAYTTRLSADGKRFEVYIKGETQPLLSCEWLNSQQLSFYESPFVHSDGSRQTLFTYMRRMSDKELKQWQSEANIIPGK